MQEEEANIFSAIKIDDLNIHRGSFRDFWSEEDLEKKDWMLEEQDDSHEKPEKGLEIRMASTTQEHPNMTQKQGETDASSTILEEEEVNKTGNHTKSRRRWHREPEQMHTDAKDWTLEEQDDGKKKAEKDFEIKMASTTQDHAKTTHEEEENENSSIMTKEAEVREEGKGTKFRRRRHCEPEQMHTYKWAKTGVRVKFKYLRKKYADMNGNFGVVQQILCRGKRVDIFVRPERERDREKLLQMKRRKRNMVNAFAKDWVLCTMPEIAQVYCLEHLLSLKKMLKN